MLWFVLKKVNVLCSALLCGALLTACVSPGPFEIGHTQVYSAKKQQHLTFAHWIDALQSYDVILIGEKHDDVRHHQAQLALLQALHRHRAIRAVALEMLPSSKQAAFIQAQRTAQEQLRRDPATDANVIKAGLEWPASWDWAQYRSLVMWMLREQIPMIGANLDQTELAIIAKGAQPLKGRVSTAPEVHEALSQLVSGHHLESDTPVQALVQAQQFKDRRMAESLFRNAKPVVLLAGNVHVNKKLGVPLHLQDYGQRKVVSIMLVSSFDGRDADQADYFWVIN